MGHPRDRLKRPRDDFVAPTAGRIGDEPDSAGVVLPRRVELRAGLPRESGGMSRCEVGRTDTLPMIGHWCLQRNETIARAPRLG
jgi:hypothetical protein